MCVYMHASMLHGTWRSHPKFKKETQIWFCQSCLPVYTCFDKEENFQIRSLWSLTNTPLLYFCWGGEGCRGFGLVLSGLKDSGLKKLWLYCMVFNKLRDEMQSMQLVWWYSQWPGWMLKSCSFVCFYSNCIIMFVSVSSFQLIVHFTIFIQQKHCIMWKPVAFLP